MESTTETARTTITAARRLRSLHLPSSNGGSELSRRFNSLRRPNNNASTTTTLTTALPTPSTGNTINHTTPANTSTFDLPQKVHIKLVPNVGMTSRCFVFDVVDHELESGGAPLKLGRYSDRTIVSDRLSFKSKVVSRYHAEIWLSEEDGKIYIKDSGSSSGTFVNHIRLSAANTESIKAQEIMDGDLIQLGVDYKGGLEPMYRAVRMRLEVNRREWQETCPNAYSLAAFQQLKNQINTANNSIKNKEEIQECCICLYCIAPFQALFIAPCSHIYHYRCLRPLLNQNYPGFSCPLCRTYSNLEASVAVEENEVMQMLGLRDASTPTTNITSEEDEDDEEIDDNSPLVAHHHREKTVLDEDIPETSASMLNSSSPSFTRPSLFFQRQISSSDGGLSLTLVGSPPRYNAGAVGEEGELVGLGDTLAREIEGYTNATAART
ncbi:unnamed protein product [Mucor hiemalis]